MTNPRGNRVCLVTTNHLSSNPRLVKEADALAEAGYRVAVVGAQWIPDLTEWDAQLSGRADWRYFPVNVERGKHPTRAHALRIRRLLGSFSPRFLWPAGMAVAAHSPTSFLLAAKASRLEADLFIGHNLGALPAAAEAARRRGAKLGFDAEDFHSGELAPTPANAADIERARWIEREYLPLCDYVTASSSGIAETYASLCGIPEPLTILNVFPVSEAPSAPTPATWKPGPSLYWFSQTVGPDRGLEDAVRALGSMRAVAFLCLRGTSAMGYPERLLELAAQCGVKDRVLLSPPAPPAEMLRLAACHDVGLALEQPVSPNREICVTNKLFTFLAAGVPFAATSTPGQVGICRKLGDAATLYEPGDWRSLARRLDELLADPAEMTRRRRLAWSLGRQTYNWDLEKEKFLGGVRSALDKSVAASTAAGARA